MATTVSVMFPPGRYVSGSIYDLVTKGNNGVALAENKHHWNFGYAIPKTPGRDWKDEPWGQQMTAAAAADWPNGESKHPSFSFKVKDGDSAHSSKPNTKAPRDHEGWPGHWVLFFRRGKQIGEIPLVNANGSENFALRAQKQVKKGDYIQVAGSFKGTNDHPQNAGGYLNVEAIAFREKGQEIVSANRPDPAKLAWASGGNTIMPSAAVVPAGATAPPVTQTAVQPHTAFLTPGVPPAAPGAPQAPPGVRQMTAKATQAGLTYESFGVGGPSGWTDELLRREGYMV